MFEARVGEKEFSPPLRRRVLLRLQRARYGRRRHKFKGISRFDRGEMAFLPLLVKIRSRFCSCQNFGVSEERFTATSASALLQANFWQRLLNFRLPAPLLLRWEAQVGFLCCLSCGHAKASRKNKVFEAVANLSSVLPPRLYLILLYLSFLLCSEFWHKLIPVFIVRCTVSLF